MPPPLHLRPDARSMPLAADLLVKLCPQSEEEAEVCTISPFQLTFWPSLAPLGNLIRRLVIGLRLTESADIR
jgi:hypothetical protein